MERLQVSLTGALQRVYVSLMERGRLLRNLDINLICFCRHKKKSPVGGGWLPRQQKGCIRDTNDEEDTVNNLLDENFTFVWRKYVSN